LLPKNARRIGHAGQREEVATADRLDILLKRLAIEALLHGQKARRQVGLEADEQQAHIHLP
jgi:hypothetical protein